MAKLLKNRAFGYRLWTLIAAIYLLPFFVVHGLGGVFVKLDGISGESMDAKHIGWIDVSSFSHALERPVQGAGASRTSGSLRHFELALKKWVDKSSPLLMDSLCKGTIFPKVELEIVNTDNTETKFMRYTLSNVLITSANIGDLKGSEDPRPTESVTLNYEEIEWTYIVIENSTGDTNHQVQTQCTVEDVAP
jgi:type VI secretion system Hcp family effector